MPANTAGDCPWSAAFAVAAEYIIMYSILLLAFFIYVSVNKIKNTHPSLQHCS